PVRRVPSTTAHVRVAPTARQNALPSAADPCQARRARLLRSAAVRRNRYRTSAYADAGSVLRSLALGLGFGPGRAGALVTELAGRLLRLAHPVLEALDRFAQILAGTAQAFGAENQQHHHQHYDPMPDAPSAHGQLT